MIQGNLIENVIGDFLARNNTTDPTAAGTSMATHTTHNPAANTMIGNAPNTMEANTTRINSTAEAIQTILTTGRQQSNYNPAELHRAFEKLNKNLDRQLSQGQTIKNYFPETAATMQ